MKLELQLSADRNKTELTQNITRQSALWLDGKGFKPVETEVQVARSWIADIAGVCCPTQTEMIELKLVARPPRYSYSQMTNPAAKQSYESKYKEWREKFEKIPQRLTALVEVKTSVSDFKGDRKWTSEWPTHLCYVAMPEGMIPADKWPQGWGVILFSQSGDTIRKVFPSEVRNVAIEQQLEVVLAVAVARDHVTRHARIRQLQKEVRVEAGCRKTLSRIQSAIQFVLKVQEGTPIEDARQCCGIRSELPDYILRSLGKIQPTEGISICPNSPS